jgi:integration host factor subunit alpha
MTLTKVQIVEAIEEQIDYRKKMSADLVETLLELIKSSLEAGDDVLISGFGKFCVKDKKQRRGRNLDTGDEMILRARKVVSFRCSRKLRHKINSQPKVQ